IPAQERSAAVYRNRGGHLLCGDDRIRHRHVQFLFDSVPALVRRRLLLGRLGHSLSGATEPSPLAQAAPSGTEDGALTASPSASEAKLEKHDGGSHRSPGKLALFGSVVTGRFTDSSDIGILVDFQ